MKFKERVLWPIGHFIDRKLLYRACPKMKAVLSRYEHYYIENQMTRKAYEERINRGIVSDFQLAYGESYWVSFISTMNKLSISSDDVFVDLGCGNGQLAIYVHLKYGIPSKGVDLTKTFIETAQTISKDFQFNEIDFIEQNFLEFDFSQATVFYVTTTCFTNEFMEKLTLCFKDAPQGSRIVTITKPLWKMPWLKLKEFYSGWFTWGLDEVRIYEKL